jgi:signal transduction histidine kinase
MKNSHNKSNTTNGLELSSWRHQSERIKFRIFIPLVLAMGVLLGAFIFTFHQDQRRKAIRDTDLSAQQVQKLLGLQQEQMTAAMATTLRAILNDDRLAEALLARDRDTLLQRAKPVYESLSAQHKVTHFYFHTPSRTNLLRVHRPEQTGDTISRYTLLEAERTGQMASGIERGPIGTFVLRVVKPWRRGGELLGYVELGMEFEEIVKDIHGLLNVDFVVAVHKKFLDREQWNNALKTYGRQGSWDQFPTTVVMDKTVDTIPQPVLDYLTTLRPEAGGTNRLASWNGRDLQLVFLPLKDVGGKALGELIVLRDVTESMAQGRHSIQFIALTCLTVSAGLIGLFYLFLTRVEKDLAEGSSKLKDEIMERQRAEEELRRAHEELGRHARDLKEANTDLNAEIAFREKAQQELDATHQRLLEASRQAGMAEVATGVLHNVGNVLNSVNVASSCLADSFRKSKAANLSKVVALLREHENDLGVFLTSDPKGKQVPGYLAQLAEHLAGEQATALKELAQLQKNIEHIKEVVTTQQSGAKCAGKPETIQVTDLVEDTLRMDSGAQVERDIQVTTEFEATPVITVEKHKVLQILTNLVRNAKQSCHEAGGLGKRLTLRVTNGDDRVRIAVSDNGVGISPENLARIFAHGFTTKKDGHGFGLHSAVAAAMEMGGGLNVQSDGIGHGATFTLELPHCKQDLLT